MSSGYVKIYGSILGSSVWAEAPSTRIVWITMLALADQNEQQYRHQQAEQQSGAQYHGQYRCAVDLQEGFGRANDQRVAAIGQVQLPA